MKQTQPTARQSLHLAGFAAAVGRFGKGPNATFGKVMDKIQGQPKCLTPVSQAIMSLRDRWLTFSGGISDPSTALNMRLGSVNFDPVKARELIRTLLPFDALMDIGKEVRRYKKSERVDLIIQSALKRLSRRSGVRWATKPQPDLVLKVRW